LRRIAETAGRPAYAVFFIHFLWELAYVVNWVQTAAP
jgi:hypothetical protein